MLVKRVFVDTSVLLPCYCAFVLLILECFSLFCGSADECHLQLVECQVYSVARPCPDQTFLLCHQRHVAALCMLYKVNLYSNHRLLSELPSASVRVWHTRAVSAAHPLGFEVSRCRMSKFARCFPAGPDICWIIFPTLCLTLKNLMDLREQFIVRFFPEFFF